MQSLNTSHYCYGLEECCSFAEYSQCYVLQECFSLAEYSPAKEQHSSSP